MLSLPLLKNLYSSSGRNAGKAIERTLRGRHHLYLIVILLLKFSQEYSFGDDAFGRIVLDAVPWYKERTFAASFPSL